MSELTVNDRYLIKNETQLRAQFGETTESIWAKATDFISEPMNKFIGLSPFCSIASCDKQGRTDISPRGDAPGFVSVARFMRWRFGSQTCLMLPVLKLLHKK